MTTYLPIFPLFRYAYMEIFKKLEWKHVASLSQSGNKYSEYINTLQDFLSKSENGGMTFIANRKFDPSKNMKKVNIYTLFFPPFPLNLGPNH